MKFKDLKAKFESEVMVPVVEQKEMPEAQFRVWLLVFLFEIYGNLDSIAVSLRDLTKISEENFPAIVNQLENCVEKFEECNANIRDGADAFTKLADLTEKRMKS